jgi:4'-phosphopantetheinyl transferase
VEFGLFTDKNQKNMICKEPPVQTAITTQHIKKTSLFQEPIGMALTKDEIHVWVITLEAENISHLKQILSKQELARAERFRFEKDKTEFIAAKAFLRIILGKYLNVSPQKLCFEYSNYGKPFIKEETKSGLKFNMSHSRGLALYALTLASEVGADLEFIDHSLVDRDVAAHSLTEYELKCFQSLPESKRGELFYKCWTRKEAYAKAQGDGLITSPDKIETLFNNTIPFYKSGEISGSAKNKLWSFIDLPEINKFSASVVVEGKSKKNLRLWQALS